MEKEKSLAVVFGDRVQDVVIGPGTTAQDILKQLGLQNHWLSFHDGLRLGNTEEVFGAIRNGEKLFASPPASVATRRRLEREGFPA